MKNPLAVGLAHEMCFTVTREMCPPHLPFAVLATPRMIALIEHTCVQNVKPRLAEGEITVGTHVNVSHVGPARVGEDVTVRSRLIEVERRRLLFAVEVESPAGVISTGTHQRTVVNPSRFIRKKPMEEA